MICATSGAGHQALFSGWGAYGASKAAVSYNLSQLALEEPDIISVGVSPGLCDTKMVQGLRVGQCKSSLSLSLLSWWWPQLGTIWDKSTNRRRLEQYHLLTQRHVSIQMMDKRQKTWRDTTTS